MEKEITYVARHYRKGAFDAKAAWKRLDITATRRWRGSSIAAAVAGVAVFAAVASVAYLKWDVPTQPAAIETEQIETQAMATHTIDFENTPLPEVVAAIKSAYGVEVENLPANAADYRLSLHYEGRAADLVDTINEILGTQMTLAQ